MAEPEDEPPMEIDPYGVLEVEESATADEIKRAYRKLALVHHPDKALPDQKDAANTKFQELAFAYAILSDHRRRKRYDITGNTAESLDIDDDDFNWLEFFRAQWQDTVTTERIVDFAGKYKGGEEERRDVLAAYTKFKGNLDTVFKEVMLSSVLDDEERFRVIIDGAIAGGEAEGYDSYVNESEKKKQARRKQAERSAREAEKHAAFLGVNGHDKKGGKREKKGGESDLAAMIQQRQKGRAANFLDDLEAKYAAPKGKSGKGKKRQSEEPPEEAFQNMGKRAKKPKNEVIEEKEDDDEDVYDDIDSVDLEENDIEEVEDDEEEQEAKPRKARKARWSSQRKREQKGKGSGTKKKGKQT